MFYDGNKYFPKKHKHKKIKRKLLLQTVNIIVILFHQMLNPIISIFVPMMQARQRASVKWILSKAFNNRVPENQRDPFYKDHEGQEHLKPQVKITC